MLLREMPVCKNVFKEKEERWIWRKDQDDWDEFEENIIMIEHPLRKSRND